MSDLNGNIVALDVIKGKLFIPDLIIGKSAYELAVVYGYKGTEEEWLESLHGKSAYELAKEGGFCGTEEEFAALLASVEGLIKKVDFPFSNTDEFTLGIGEVEILPGDTVTMYTGQHEFIANFVPSDGGEAWQLYHGQPPAMTYTETFNSKGVFRAQVSHVRGTAITPEECTAKVTLERDRFDWLEHKQAELEEESEEFRKRLPIGTIYSDGSVALSGGIAGGRAFKILSVKDNGDGTGAYLLDSTLGIEIGMEYSAVLQMANYRGGRITAIDGNTVTVDGYIHSELNPKEDDPENHNVYNTFHIYMRPELGTHEVGFCAFSIGEWCYASNTDASAFGRETKAIGKYGTAMNLGSIAGHAAFAANSYNRAIADSSAVFGANNYTRRGANKSFIGGGAYNEISAAQAATLGGQGLKATSYAEGVAGTYNDYNDDTNCRFSVGIGTGEADRRNGLVIYGDGKAKIGDGLIIGAFKAIGIHSAGALENGENYIQLELWSSEGKWHQLGQDIIDFVNAGGAHGRVIFADGSFLDLGLLNRALKTNAAAIISKVGIYFNSIEGFSELDFKGAFFTLLEQPTWGISLRRPCVGLVGCYNDPDSIAMWAVGNGSDDANRSNAFEVFADGHAEVKKMGKGVNSVVTKGYLDGKIGDIDSALDELHAYAQALIGGEA